MESIFLISFALLFSLLLGLEKWKKHFAPSNSDGVEMKNDEESSLAVIKTSSFLSFRNNYILVYSLMMGE